MPTADPVPDDLPLLPITEVERLTGIRQGTLRMWERRYGLPQPARDRNGKRVYPPEQVAQLQAVRRLMDEGVRPGRIFAQGKLPGTAAPTRLSAQHQALIGLLRAYRLAELHARLRLRLMKLGLRRFVLDCLAPLSDAVAEAGRSGELPLRCVRLYAQLLAAVLHASMAGIRTAAMKGPTAVLATLPGDSPLPRILMAEAVLATFDIDCIQLGADVPPQEVAAAAREACADIVVLSFSTAFPRREFARQVAAVRADLPARVALWVGGAGLRHARTVPEGVEVVASLDAIGATITRWQEGAGRGE